jgi:hypothetical protein
MKKAILFVLGFLPLTIFSKGVLANTSEIDKLIKKTNKVSTQPLNISKVDIYESKMGTQDYGM